MGARRRIHVRQWTAQHQLHKAVARLIDRGGMPDDITAKIIQEVLRQGWKPSQPTGLNTEYCPVHRSIRTPCKLCIAERPPT